MMMGEQMDASAMRATLRDLARRSSAPVWNRLWPRVENIAERIADRKVDAASGELREEFGRRGDDLHREIADLRGELESTRNSLTGRLDWIDNVLARMGPHVAAVDERVGDLERTGVSGAEDEAGEANSLVAEVRAEHAKVRARLTAIAKYEERIARLEQAVAASEKD